MMRGVERMERRRSDFILLILAGVKQKLEGSNEILPSHVTRQCSPKDISAPAQRAPETSSEDAHAQGAPARMSWARLLKRVFDIEHCPNCGGALNRKFQLSLRQLTRSLVKRYISGQKKGGLKSYT